LSADERTLIGWHSISVWTPADWVLAAVGGDDRSGYLRIDDQLMPRLQVKWSPGPIDLQRKREEYAKRLSGGGPVSLGGRVLRMVPVLGKSRRPAQLEVDTEARVLSQRAKPKKDLLGFAWRGRYCGMGVLWNCEVCERAVIAQVSWLPQERLHETAREVLASLEDHGTEGWRWWGLDGLSFLAPESYLMERHKRLSRHLEMRLAAKKGGSWLSVARWGMVSLVLEGRTVAEWFADHLSGRRDITWQSEEMPVKGHEGIAAWGAERGLSGGVRRALGRAVRRGGSAWTACAWHCPEANRLYLVESVEPESGEVLKAVVDSIICHEEP